MVNGIAIFACLRRICYHFNAQFYSPVKGWTQTINLRAGDILVTVNGEYVVVKKVQHEILENPVQVYNWTGTEKY